MGLLDRWAAGAASVGDLQPAWREQVVAISVTATDAKQ